MKKVWVKSRTTNVDVFSIEINGEENIENLKDAIITKMKFTYAAPLLRVLTVGGGSEFFIKPGTLINTVLSDSTNSEENPIYFKEPEGAAGGGQGLFDHSDSVPPYRLCIFVLCRSFEGGFKTVGTAVAVESAGRNILLTAGHCVKFTSQASYFCVPKLSDPYNLSDKPNTAFNVDVIAHKSSSPDIAILRRSDGQVFDISCPVLMLTRDLPWNSDPSGWGGHAYVYHVPLEVIDHAPNDEAGAPDVVGDVDSVTIHMPSPHHFRLRGFDRGSSGGAVISSGGLLMGILTRTQLYGTLTMDGVRTHTYQQLAPHSSLESRGGKRSEAIEASCGETDEKERDREEDGWSISAASTSIPEKGSTAVIPSTVNLHFCKSTVSLPDFLQQEEQAGAKGEEVELKLTAKEGGSK